MVIFRFMILLVSASGFIVGQTQAVSAAAPRRVGLFSIQHKNLIDALLSFGQQEQIPVAIEYVDKAAFQRTVSVDCRRCRIEEVLDTITHPLGYRWQWRGRVLVVFHRGALVGGRNLLNTRIPRFQIKQTTMHAASRMLIGDLDFLLDPHTNGVVGDDPGGNLAFLVGPLDLRNASVRDILDKIISQRSNGAWVAQQPPWTMGKDLGSGIWKVLEYDRTDGEYSRELLVRGIDLESR